MMLSSPVRISSAGMLSIPGDLPIFSDKCYFSISCSDTLFSLMIFSTAVYPVTG